jgi:hypothetical protein
MSTGDDPSKVYGGMVADIIASAPRESSWEPANPVELYVKDRKVPASAAELSEIERLQLERMVPDRDIDRAIREGLEDFPLDIEIAIVVDDTGAPVYRLYGMNYGIVFLMKADTLECVAFACQHDLEHWNLAQRDLFWAMDRALRRSGHGFQQPMKFCWWEQKCWDEIAGKEPGTVQSEPYVRQQFAGKN